MKLEQNNFRLIMMIWKLSKHNIARSCTKG